MKKNKKTNNLNVLIGNNYFVIHQDATILKQQQLNYNPEWSTKPYSLGSLNCNPREFPRLQSDVNIFSNHEANSEIGNNYAHKSFMSLDGLFSPVSFYPTPYSSTFHISKYLTSGCPFCNGTKTYTYKIPKDQASITQNQGATAVVSSYDTQSIICTFCETLEEKLSKMSTSSSPKESYPPYVIASGNDLTIISNIIPATGNGSPVINYATLNPIVLTTGEFSNFTNKQKGDVCGHCIDLVGFSMIPPTGDNGLRPIYSANIERSYLDYDVNMKEWYANLRAQGVSIPPDPTVMNNMRFFGLRGPLMVHGWGYDLEGYPVPNSSGEPKTQGGSIVRDINGNIIGKNQKFISTSTGSGYWSKPYKENTFYKGWAQSPGTWPVGPIDLRWDEAGRVWTVGANYKPVFVVIEEDLVNTSPVRAEIIDSSYDNSPLPTGLRRLVFVRDQLGLFPAPRGGTLYCKYNSNNGFYEPIGHRPFVTSGVINSTNSVEIYKIYTKPNNPSIKLSDDPNLQKYTTTYKNPLNFGISPGGIGLFTFLDGYWTLTSYNCN
jgi:hypothetical protein